MTFSTVPAILQHVKSGRVRALGITGERITLLPDVLSMTEAGYPSVDASPMFGMVAPTSVSAAIVAKLNISVVTGIKSDPLRSRVIELGFVPVGSTADEFKARIAAEIAKWTRIIEKGNIKPT